MHNGPHDVGGARGFGPVDPTPDAVAYPEGWEGRCVGAVIGAIAGGGKGAAIGAGSGATLGTLGEVFTSGQRVRVPSETRLTFRLQQPLLVN